VRDLGLRFKIHKRRVRLVYAGETAWSRRFGVVEQDNGWIVSRAVTTLRVPKILTASFPEFWPPACGLGERARVPDVSVTSLTSLGLLIVST
jgi:hypothetical protein